MPRLFKIFFSLVSVFGLLALFYFSLIHPNKSTVTAKGLVGKPLPTFKLPDLDKPHEFFTQEKIRGKVSLLNVWASWCSACIEELPMLLNIKNQYHIPIFSINYKDEPAEAKQFLNQYGNPFEKTGLDLTGNTSIDLGIYGMPETFIVNQQGKVVYRHIGIIDENNWRTIIFPRIQKLLASK